MNGTETNVAKQQLRDLMPDIDKTGKIRTGCYVKKLVTSARDPTDPLCTPGTYQISWSCGALYFGTTKRYINTRIAEHRRNCPYG